MTRFEADGVTVGKSATRCGELALLTDQARSASVVALDGDAELYRITASDFRSELHNLRPWVRDIVKTLAERVRKHDLLA